MNRQIYKLLQEQDWNALGEQLVRYASRRAWIYRWRDGGNWELVAGTTVEDVVQHVIVKTIAGERKWDPDKGPLTPWLKAQVKSVMDALYHSWPHHHEAALPEPDSDEDEVLRDKLEHHALKAYNHGTTELSSPEEVLLEKERKERARKFVERRFNVICQATNGDPELEAIVDAIMDGCEPKRRYIAAAIGVTPEEITNRKKRILRRLSRLLEEQEDT